MGMSRSTILALLICAFISILALETTGHSGTADAAKFPPMSDEEIAYINSVPGVKWKAERNFHPHELERVRSKLRPLSESLVNVRRPRPRSHNTLTRRSASAAVLPVNFTCVTKWPKCLTMRQVRDQGDCSSGYAHSVAATISDRICIATGQSVNISAEDIMACDSKQHGCAGGRTDVSWAFYMNEGVVTGGAYDSKQGCLPNPMTPCDRNLTSNFPPCSGHGKTPVCSKKCRDGYNKTYVDDKHKAMEWYSVMGNKSMMWELFDNGPITADFMVFSDFLSYKSGVYHHVTGDFVANHAVKILGWGVEGGVQYWRVANSWNTHWGDHGFVKIKKGSCGIEGYVTSAMPAT